MAHRLVLRSWLLLPWLIFLGGLEPVSASTVRVSLGDGTVAALTDDQEIFVEAPPLEGEGLLAYARRLTGEETAVREISRINRGVLRLLNGVRYKVPYELLKSDLKLRAFRALFPADQPQPAGWVHRVSDSSRSRTLWKIAEWLTGRGENFSLLRDRNELTENEVAPGQSVVVPASLLLPIFAAQLPPPSSQFGLEYVNDSSGEYAVYRLKRGEALYSSVVVRFTGRTFAEDVNAYAAELARLNGIADVTDMPVGQPIRVPYEQLLPEFLPPGHPRRQEYERARLESALYSNSVTASRLEGITVILDAGHGGQDPGAMQDNVWESIYVYDIVLRTKRLLEATTAATVVPTTRDGDEWRLSERDKLPRTRGHAVLTDPAYHIADTKVGVNLRWYLANSVHRAAVTRSGDPEKTIFISVHADALHPSLRGAMIYTPAAQLTKGEFGQRGKVYTTRKEVRERPRVNFSWKERVKSEGLSRELAAGVIGGFRQRRLAVHHEKPIRDRIIRSRRWIFVPAVLRYNAVPAKILLEVCNLNNSEDRQLLQTQAFREQVANAIVDGILEYYGQTSGPGQLTRNAR